MKRNYAIMGKIVTVEKELCRHHCGTARTWLPRNVPPRAGWVVGWRSLQNGRFVQGDFEQQSYLVVESIVPCMLVAYWPTQNPVRVPLDGYTLGGEPQPSAYRWSDADKDSWRALIANVPRDEKGRFTGWPATMTASHGGTQ